MNWFAVALGGAIGASCRYALTLVFSAQPSKFPIATFLANSIGCFLMGVALVYMSEKIVVSEVARQFLLLGVFGALTTYSSFAVEVNVFIQAHDYKMAVIYILATLLSCIFGAALGIALAKTVF